MVEEKNTEAAVGRYPNGRWEFTAAALKWIAIVSMFIDHVGAAVLERILIHVPQESIYTLAAVDRVLRAVGRIAFPIFIFLLIEGFHHTRSRGRYLARLTVFAFLSDIPFDLAFFLKGNPFVTGVFMTPKHQNVFFTLALGFLSMWLIENVRPKGVLNLKAMPRVLACIAIGAAGCLAAEALHTDYSWGGVIAILAGYLFYPVSRRKWEDERIREISEASDQSENLTAELRENQSEERSEYIPAEQSDEMLRETSADLPVSNSRMLLPPPYLSPEAVAIIAALIVRSSFEVYSILDYPLFLCYNGEKGDMKVSRWFFYAFYPLHLLFLAAIRIAVFGE